jgi:succinyl-CoA synthetase alpha subunit
VRILSVLIDQETTVLIQGLTSKTATKHAMNMAENNTNIVAGVVPKRGGTQVNRWPIYDSVQQALEDHPIDLSLIYAPPKYASDAIVESIESGIRLIVCVTEGIPAHDMLRIFHRLKGSSSTLIGPCSPGIFNPGKVKVGFIPDAAGLPGNVGVVGKSGTLTYQICYQMKQEGIGQSSIVGIGGDSIKGFSFIDALERFEKDEETNSIVMIGEIGGSDEEEAAKYIKTNISKPVIGFIAGSSAPKDVPMGHAGALVSQNQGGYQEKVDVLRQHGVYVADSLFEITSLIKELT